jgi:hypothetical protein
MTLSLEQRKRQAELIGKRVRGTTPAQLRIERGGVCAECGGPLPCAECAKSETVPAAERTKRRAAVVNHTAAARADFDLLMAREGPTPTRSRTVRKVDAVAEARRDYDRMRREAGR